MASIKIISTSRVCAASDKQSNLNIELTPWDLLLILAEYSQKGILFHKPKSEEQFENNLIKHLKSSLSQTLDLFAPLAGRFATIEHDDNTTSFFIDCNNAGAEFVHASADGVSVADIIQPIYVPKIVYSFFPLNGVRNYEGTSKPLLAVQITELEDGIFIGISVNHTVVDATSFWHFVNSWSEISRGCECLSKPAPILERWFLRDKDCPIHLPPFSIEQLSNSTYVPPPLEQRVFHFSKETIAKLKAKANAEIGTNKISSFQSLLSHFGRSLVRNKYIDDDPNQEMEFQVIMGVRPRMNPPLPQNYFGNASQCGIVTMKARELLDQGLGYMALEINKILAMHTDEKLKDLLVSWTENPHVDTMERMLSNATFLLIGSMWVDVYGNDFGWGSPVAVRTGPANKIDGTITMFPGVEQGSIDFEACLSPQTLQGMRNDAEFMDAVTYIP
ncbi:hypothetical protein LWI28_023597 [Acer negundo]|uniref:HXXXD-type acyl-transferase family protein n=1 Tax=Acer negundo TaxID=4023 RepID=A0AAD5IKE1_ACENE|nr:hypothetical protein LWI28_023597 [Acer negundo]